MAVIQSTRDNWLLDAAKIGPGDRVEVYPKDTLTAKAAQAAVDAQYGKDTLIRCWVHGNRFSAFIHPDPEALARFDARRRDDKITYEQGKRDRLAGKPFRKYTDLEWRNGWNDQDALI